MIHTRRIANVDTSIEYVPNLGVYRVTMRGSADRLVCLPNYMHKLFPPESDAMIDAVAASLEGKTE